MSSEFGVQSSEEKCFTSETITPIEFEIIRRNVNTKVAVPITGAIQPNERGEMPERPKGLAC